MQSVLDHPGTSPHLIRPGVNSAHTGEALVRTPFLVLILHEQTPVGIPLPLAILVNSSSASISPLRIVVSCLRSALRNSGHTRPFCSISFVGAGDEGTILRCDKAGSISQTYRLRFIPSGPLACPYEDPCGLLVGAVLEGMSMGRRSYIA
jgi:hypothetical protein